MQFKRFDRMSHVMREAADPLYNKSLLRLAADAVGSGRLAAPDGAATAANPACGDTVTMTVALHDGRIAAIAHDTRACLLTQASAAILGRIGPGMDANALAALQRGVLAMLKSGSAPPLADYDAFEGACALPGRHICVLLPIQALLEALERAEPGA